MWPILAVLGGLGAKIAMDKGLIENPFKQPQNTNNIQRPAKGTWTFRGPIRNVNDADIVLVATSVINGTHTLTPNQFAAIKHELYERGKRNRNKNMLALARQLKNVRLV